MEKSLIIFLLAVLSLSVVSGLDVKISIVDSFSVGENVEFDYTFIPDKTEKIDYFIGAECSEVTNFPSQEKIELSAGEEVTKKYAGFNIEDGKNYKDCYAFVVVFGQDVKDEKSFQVDEKNVEKETPEDNQLNNDEDNQSNNETGNNDEDSLSKKQVNANESDIQKDFILNSDEIFKSFGKIIISVIISLVTLGLAVIIIFIIKKKRESDAEIELNNVIKNK